MVVPPVGSLPVSFLALQNLQPHERKRIDMVYAVTQKTEDDKWLSFYSVSDDRVVTEIDPQQETELPTIVAEDIFDTAWTWGKIQERYPGVNGFAPVGKGSSADKLSLVGVVEEMQKRIPVDLYIGKKYREPETIMQPSLHVVVMIEDKWAHTGFGMNGNSRVLKEIDLARSARIQRNERLASVCLQGSVDGTNLEEYEAYLAINQLNFPVGFTKGLLGVVTNNLLRQSPAVHSDERVRKHMQQLQVQALQDTLIDSNRLLQIGL